MIERACKTAAGTPKRAYDTEERAMHDMHTVLRYRGDRLHVYRCAEHGFHLGHAVPVRPLDDSERAS